MSVCACVCPYGHQGAQTAGPVYLDDPDKPHAWISSLKSKGNQWTLAETGQPRARLTSNQPCTQTHQDTLAAHTASNLPGVCTQTAQLTDTGNHYERQTVSVLPG